MNPLYFTSVWGLAHEFLLLEPAVGDTLRIENLGQIKKADITFDDLTVFVGPQAAGKSIALQLLKLLVDARPVKAQLQRYGVDWNERIAAFFDAY
jgi:DNA repair ATPase RecN